MEYNKLNIPKFDKERLKWMQEGYCYSSNSECDQDCDNCLFYIDHLELFIQWKTEKPDSIVQLN